MWIVSAKLFLNLLDLQVIWQPAVVLRDSWLWVPCSNACQQFLPCGCLVIRLFSECCASPHIHLDSVSPNFCHGTNESMSNGAVLPSSYFHVPSGGWAPEKMVLLAPRGGFLSGCQTALGRGKDRMATCSRMNIQKAFRKDKAKEKGVLVQQVAVWSGLRKHCKFRLVFAVLYPDAFDSSNLRFYSEYFSAFCQVLFFPGKKNNISLETSLGSGRHVFVASTVI